MPLTRKQYVFISISRSRNKYHRLWYFLRIKCLRKRFDFDRSALHLSYETEKKRNTSHIDSVVANSAITFVFFWLFFFSCHVFLRCKQQGVKMLYLVLTVIFFYSSFLGLFFRNFQHSVSKSWKYVVRDILYTLRTSAFTYDGKQNLSKQLQLFDI